MALGILVALVAAIGIAAAMSGSEDSEEPGLSVEPTPTDSTASASPPPTMQEYCVEEMLGIVQPMVAEFAATGQYGTAQQQAVGEYGMQNPVFLMALQRVLPEALMVAGSYGIDAGLESARTAAEAACQDELSESPSP